MACCGQGPYEDDPIPAVSLAARRHLQEVLAAGGDSTHCDVCAAVAKAHPEIDDLRRRGDSGQRMG